MYGRHVSELDTPALCIDLDRMDRNMEAMASFFREHGKQWRPHIKCHKTPALAHLQLASGAIGVTTAKVSEAEVFLQNGIQDVLIANMIVGQPKLERLAGLCRWGNPIVAVDHYVQAEALAAICRQRGTTCRIIIEVNVGFDRVGVRPGLEARDLARGVAQLQGISLVGMMGYEGHLSAIADLAEKERRIASSMAILAETRDQMLSDGLCCDIVSAGGTATYPWTVQQAAVTEVQAGGGIFGDPFYADACGIVGLESALRLLSTVVSRSKLERGILDVGRKSLHPDVHPPRVVSTALGRPLGDALITRLSAEHTTLELGPESQSLRIGDKVQIVPGYCDHTTPLHTHFYGLRNDLVEVIWPIAARGMIW